jgi:hypothetical protein
VHPLAAAVDSELLTPPEHVRPTAAVWRTSLAERTWPAAYNEFNE